MIIQADRNGAVGLLDWLDLFSEERGMANQHKNLLSVTDHRA
jgi:hypothetical protein